MSLINLQEVNLAFNEQVIFDQADLTIDAGYKYALVGLNGSGKSTFFKLLCHEILPDSGKVNQAKNCIISYLGQHSLQSLDKLAHVYDNPELTAVETEMNELSQLIAAADKRSENNKDLPVLLKRYTETQAEFERLGGYGFTASIKAALAGLNLPAELIEQAPITLSGGEKMKVALAHCLLRPADLILLDEPTNHLDLLSCDWLADFIKKSKKTFIVVSHDRYFLDRISDKTIMLEGHKFTVYSGNYTQARKLAYEQKQIQAKELERLNEKLNIETAVKQTFLSHRNISGYHQREKVVNSLNAKIKQLKEQQIGEKRLKFSFNQPSSLGEKDYKRLLVSVKDLSKKFDKQLFQHLDFSLKANEKAALIGRNGTGKTTLLKILLGEELPDSGEIKLYGDLQIAYMGQIINFPDPSQSLLDYLMHDNTIPERYIRAQLANYGFDSSMIDKPLRILSGGERHRIFLAKLINAHPDILFLDEPTNHLDLYSIERLENALQNYAGALVVVSHDRYFVEKIANKIYGFVDCRLKEYASYEEWWKTYLSSLNSSNIDSLSKEKALPAVKTTSSTIVKERKATDGNWNKGKIRALKVQAQNNLNTVLQLLTRNEQFNQTFLQNTDNTPQSYEDYNLRLQLGEKAEELYLELSEELEKDEACSWAEVQTYNTNLEKTISNLEKLLK